MKRIIAFLLAFVLTGACLPITPAIAEEGQPFIYQLLGDGTVEITGYTGSGGDVVIPETIDGYTVSGIGDGAFCGCSTLETLVLPEGHEAVATAKL